MSLAVIILSKDVNNLAPCVTAVKKNEPDARIIVVDDGLAWRPDGCEYVEGAKPFIYARNCNLGIAKTGEMLDITERQDTFRRYAPLGPCSDVVLLNDDALLTVPGGFSLMQRAWEENQDYGIIGAVTNLTGQPLQRPRNQGLRQVPHIAFVCVFIPASTILKVGLLDERYCLDYGVEDRDYCEAVTRAGLKVGVHDHCFVDHGSLRSTFRGDPKAPKSFQQNLGLFRQKWGIIE